MNFTETKLSGAFIIEIKKFSDERGFFADSFSEKEFAEHGLPTHFVQCSVSFTQRKGVLRGMHEQLLPHAQGKLVRCTRGAVYDVIIDLRKDSPTFCQWVGTELNEDSHRLIYIPKGFAHGFQALTDKAEIFYQLTDVYAPQCARGVRWDDPAFKITWPIHPPTLNERDAKLADFTP